MALSAEVAVLDRSAICVAGAEAPDDVRRLIDAADRAGATGLFLSSRQLNRIRDLDRFQGAGPIAGLEATPLTGDSREEMARQVVAVTRDLHAAGRFGLDGVGLYTGAPTPAAFEFLADGLTRVTRAARVLGLRVRLRNRGGTRIEQPQDLHRLFWDVRADNLALDIDVAEFHRSSVHPCEPIRAFEGRIDCVRLANIDAGRPAGLAEGEIDIRSVVDALRDASYRGPIVLQLAADERAAARLERDVRFVEELMS